MIQENIKTPELLAPAGNLAAALTAYDAGADAVYTGLKKFNAREQTENLSFEEFSKLSEYARKNDKKVYLTLNTLIKESELTEVAEYISKIYTYSPNALIVQDLGVLRLLREFFPDLNIHASTQMGLHNSYGVNLASRLGVKRVILERQVTFEEIKSIKENAHTEIEVFVHGALCCSLSGNCLFSSWLGGWSGNRGQCKQPCRRRYYSEGGNGFFFSTKDLYSLDIIQDLKKVGVDSIKIEGRSRKPDYVKNVVSAYRRVLDTHPDDFSVNTLKEAKNTLSYSFGRKWSPGFRKKVDFKNVIDYKTMGVAGLPIGKVISRNQYGFSAKITKSLSLGDRVRIHPKSGDEGTYLTVTKMSSNKKEVKSVPQGKSCFIYCDKEIPVNGILYKIGKSEEDLSNKISNLKQLAFHADLYITINDNGITVRISNIPELPIWNNKAELQRAFNAYLTEETVKEEFNSSRSDYIKSGLISVKIEGKYFIPASSLKKIRREFWNWVIENTTEKMLYPKAYAGLDEFKDEYSKLTTKIKPEFPKKHVLLNKTTSKPAKDSIPVHRLNEVNAKTKEILLPFFCSEKNLPQLNKKINKAISKGIKDFRVSSLYAFELLKNYEDIRITTSFPLPVTNSCTCKVINAICFKNNFSLESVQCWVELEKAELENLQEKSITNMEIYKYGRPHLLATRAKLAKEGKITDSKGETFFIKYDASNGLYTLYPGKVFSLPVEDDSEISTFVDLTNAEYNEEETSSFNYYHTFV